jgi:mRNA deadenylase 3'-5' endonuclease subunit Ccr4
MFWRETKIFDERNDWFSFHHNMEKRRRPRRFLSSCLLFLLLQAFSNTSTALNLNNPKTMFQSSSKAVSVRVVSYNVLSSHLAQPSHFATYPPAHLDASSRLTAVFNKLEHEMKQEANTVLCLQEVSYDWAGSLHTFFASRGYHCVAGQYGKKFNGYMGVVLAWPVETLEAVHVDISRLADQREGGWPARNEPSALERLWNSVNALVDSSRKFAGLPVEEVIDHWNMSERRFNVLVTAVLREKESGRQFCIGNYHMPCAYYAPMVMTIHADLAARHVQKLAQEHGVVPHVLAGDFNIKPSESIYKLLTTGAMDRDDPFYPTPKNDMEWTPTAAAMQSAYALSEHGEPNFTNYARVKEQEPFIDTLDYIFLSQKHWKVRDVKAIPHRDEYSQLPNLDREEPSDHVLIAASLALELAQTD